MKCIYIGEINEPGPFLFVKWNEYIRNWYTGKLTSISSYGTSHITWYARLVGYIRSTRSSLSRLGLLIYIKNPEEKEQILAQQLGTIGACAHFAVFIKWNWWMILSYIISSLILSNGHRQVLFDIFLKKRISVFWEMSFLETLW